MDKKSIDRSTFPLRPQTAYGTQMQIRDASDDFRERPSYSSPDIDLIESEGLFADDEVVIGIGRPNVFTLIPDSEEGDQHLRFAAKSLNRAPSVVEETKGRIQSSIFMILKGLSYEQIQDIYESALDHVGSKEITCVRANMKMLVQGGIQLQNGEDLAEIMWPGECFREIVKHGLEVDGQPIDIELLKTTNRYLEDQVFQTKLSVAMTPYRHLKRYLVSKGIMQKEEPKVNDTQILVPHAQRMLHHDHHMSDITLTAANTPKISRHLRRLWGAHGILGISQDRVDINDYLTEKLKAYPQEKPDIATIIKKKALFNKYVVGAINFFLQKGYSEFPDKTESNIHTLFETHSEQRPCKYNIVASTEGIKLMKINVKNSTVDWLFTKHVLISNYDKNVKYASEARKDTDGVININRNSGTYAPSEDQLDSFIQFLQEVFPNVVFRADYDL